MDDRLASRLQFPHGSPTRIRSPRTDQAATLARGSEHASRATRSPLEPAGADLKRAFVAAMLEWIDVGWTLGEFSSISGHFFCTRGADRRGVAITHGDPGQVGRF
jgi:hypothetical protein